MTEGSLSAVGDIKRMAVLEENNKRLVQIEAHANERLMHAKGSCK